MEQLLIGRVLADRYRVSDILGRGGMSVVYRSLDTRLNRPLALKIVAFPPDIAEDDRRMLRDRLRREATAAASLSSHPHVVQVYDYGTDDALDLDFIAMELLVGEDLKEVLAGGGVEYSDAVDILRAATGGVAAGHRAGIIHRDVKPANIFLTSESGRTIVKVLDFGIAKALDPSSGDDLTRHDHTPHSPAYASPEQLALSGQTPASDVYQLGLVAYELLAGERPFTADDRQLIAAGSVVPLPRGPRWAAIPPAVRDVIERALDPDPAVRFQDAIQLGAALDAAIEDDLTVALPGLMSEVAPVEGGEAGRKRRKDDRIDGVEGALGADGSLVEAPLETEVPTPIPTAEPTPSPAGRNAGRPTPYPLLLAGLAVIAMIVWLIGRQPASVPAPAEAAGGGDAPTVTNLEVQDAEMRPLMLEAYENLGAEAP